VFDKIRDIPLGTDAAGHLKQNVRFVYISLTLKLKQHLAISSRQSVMCGFISRYKQEMSEFLEGKRYIPPTAESRIIILECLTVTIVSTTHINTGLM
jgi:hypothetical protein